MGLGLIQNGCAQAKSLHLMNLSHLNASKSQRLMSSEPTGVDSIEVGGAGDKPESIMWLTVKELLSSCVAALWVLHVRELISTTIVAVVNSGISKKQGAIHLIQYLAFF